jgi:antitoxin component of RelBE/YafQ-DinJ toxin-antitoxin module
MSDTSTIHVPVDPTIRKKFTAKAKQLGFDSAQAYLRVIIKAAVDGRRINLDVDEWGEPSDAAAARLNKAAEEAKKGVNLAGPFKTVDEFMKDL